MRIRDLLSEQSGEFDLLWKIQMAVGTMLVLFGLMIVLFPAILAYLVAAAVIATGAGLVGSAWRLRRLEKRMREVAYVEVIEL